MSSSKWLDPNEIALDTRIAGAFTLVLCGVATWDVFRTIPFDLSIITGRRRWRWTMLLYFICRIAMLTYVYTFAAKFNTVYEFQCQSMVYLSKAADAVGTCGSSLILVLRTWAVWQNDWKVIVGLGASSLVQIVLWGQSLTVEWSESSWDPKNSVCSVTSTAPSWFLILLHSFTMAFDLVILLLCATRLRFLHRTSTLAHMLLRDGIGYFCAAFIVNLVQTVMAGLNLNPVMIIIALPLTLVVSVIASTTVFRNVFIAYDGFRDNSANWSSTSCTSRDENMFISGSFFTTITSLRVTMDDLPTNDYKSQDTGAVSCHRGVVGISVDAVNTLPPPRAKASRS